MQLILKGTIRKYLKTTYSDGNYYFSALPADYKASDSIFLCEHTIETEIPDIDTRSIEAQILKDKLADVKARHTVEVLRIESAIKDLLCIGSDVIEVAA